MRGIGIGLACLAFVILLGVMMFAGQTCSGNIGGTTFSVTIPHLPPAPPPSPSPAP
jgi:hypothetical protein